MTGQATRNLHTPAERLPDESFEEYKARRRSFNRKRKDYLKGTMVRPGSTLSPVKVNGKVLKDGKTGEVIKERHKHKPLVGEVKQLIKGQA